MDIRFTGQNIKITSGMKEHLEAHLPKLEKYAPSVVEAHVFLKKEKYIFRAEIALTAKGFRAIGVAEKKDNIFAAIDEAYVRIEKQLKKFRAKSKGHHKKIHKSSAKVSRALKMIEAEEVDLPESPKVVSSKALSSKPMSVEEASLQLEATSESFVVFRNRETDEVNVIHKLKSGNHGLIEP